MTISHLLQDFGKYHGSGPDPILSDATLEEHQLEAFEQGYQAGWDDSARAHDEDHTRISSELATTLQQLSFTFHDAQAQVLKSLRPLFHQIAETLLPEMARAALPSIVAEQLESLASEHQADTLVLTVSSSDQAAIEAVVKEHSAYSIKFVSNPAFSHGQVEISAGHEERSVDLSHVVAGVAEALAAFGDEAQRKGSHG